MNCFSGDSPPVSMRDFFVSEMNRIQREIKYLWDEYERCDGWSDADWKEKQDLIYTQIQKKDEKVKKLFRKVRELDEYSKL